MENIDPKELREIADKLSQIAYSRESKNFVMTHSNMFETGSEIETYQIRVTRIWPQIQ